MHNSVTALVALAALSVASPVELRGTNMAFTLPQVQSNVTKYQIAPALAMLKTYKKYSRVGAVAPESIKVAATSAAAAVQSGTVAATPEAARTFNP